ncbi:heat-stable 19 kDa antigen [Fusarium pseudoanthophilum]|uniref:Heat-stable 19 kDa antigen n=1 Tax=Fusarium pseudoanthophilum TaxID=48495 RepID=A0A8H5UW74_9HYPO|nr:heat-stable 19 kDa antigen [Fusarium pseudoanthophilum]
MFKSKSIVVGLLLSSVSAVSLTYSKLYDNNSIPVSQLACYKNGLILDGYPSWKTIGDIPHSITGLEQVDGPQSPLCGSCWILTYGETSRPVLILDSAKEGFVSTLDTLNWLTGGKGEELGSVEVKPAKVDITNCGFAPGDIQKEL